MRSSPKPAILALGAALSLSQVALGAEEPKKDAKKPSSKSGKSKTPKNAKPVDESNDLNVPVPKGEPQRSVKFPLYNSQGALDMKFEIGVATRVDAENVKLQKLRIETYKDGDEGKRIVDMNMDLPDAMLNQKTKDITSNTAVTIKCKDFEVTGNTMKFNLETRQGTLGGGVKMIVADMASLSGGSKDEKAKIEFQKSKEEPK